jgi:hypothetical protein
MTEQKSDFMTHEAFRERIDSEIESINVLRLSLGGLALKTAAEKKQFRDAAEDLLDAAAELVSDVDELSEDKEAFGGEQSYWTVYRLFTSEKNRFQCIDPELVWKHLAKNYDMSLETPQTVRETLFEWANDMATDAQQKLGINGSFDEVDGQFVFAQWYSPGQRVEESQPATPHREPITFVEQAAPIETEVIEDDVKAMLSSFTNGSAPQPDIKRALIAKYETVSHDRLQLVINDLVVRGEIIKTRPNKITQLSLPRPEMVQDALENAAPESIDEKHSFEIEVMILTALSAPGAHYQQTRTPEELARMIFDIPKSEKVSDEYLESVRKACRVLQRIDIVSGGRKKIGSGGVKTNSATSSKRRRSASNEVFQVGLPSQQVKNQIKSLIDTGKIATYLDEQTTYVR